MSAYFYSVGALLLFISVLSFILPKQGEGAPRLALGVIMTAAIVMPLSLCLPSVDFGGIIEDIKNSAQKELPLYSADCREALEEGIADAVCAEFSLKEGSVSVRLCNFDFDNMRAERIVVTLSGVSVFANLEKIEEFVGGLGLGECKGTVEIG